MPLLTDAYLGDTQHLTLEENGAYLKLLMIAWRTPDCCLPDDDQRLATMLGVTKRRWRDRLRPVIEPFWDIADGVWTQKKQLKVRKKVEKNVQQKRDAYSQTQRAKRLKEKETDQSVDSSNDQSHDPPAEEPTKTKTIESESYTDSESYSGERESDRGVGKGGDPPPAEPMAQPPPAPSKGRNSGKDVRQPARAGNTKGGAVRIPPPEILSDTWRTAAEEACPGVNADHEFAKFLANYTDRRLTAEKWLGLWRKWMLNDVDKTMVAAPATVEQLRPKFDDPEGFGRRAVAVYRRVLIEAGGTGALEQREEFKLKMQAISIANGGGKDFGLDRAERLTADQLIRRIRRIYRADQEPSERRETG